MAGLLSSPRPTEELKTALSYRSETRVVLSQVGQDEFLNINRQPHFVVELLKTDVHAHLRLVYCNPALLEHSTLPADLVDQLDEDGLNAKSGSRSALAKWLLAERTDLVVDSSYNFSNYTWLACCTIEHRYIVVSGSPNPTNAHEPKASDETKQPRRVDDENWAAKAALGLETSHYTAEELHLSKNPVFDLTQGQYDADSLTTHLHYALNINWSTMPLGAMSTWSASLRSAFNMVMTDVYASILFWGEENIMIYNALYPSLIQGSHPCMGKPALEALPRYADILKATLSGIRANGQTLFYEDLPLFYSRDSNDLVEGYFSLKTTPLLDETGKVMGFYQINMESTNRILLQRRIDTFTSIGALTTEAKSLSDIWHLIIDSMSNNDKDIPFALVYTISNETAILEGSINMSDDQAANLQPINLLEEDAGYSPLLRESMRLRKLLVAHVADGSLPEDLVSNIKSQAFGDAIRSLAISPILNGDVVLGFLVVGCNPRRPFDDAYSTFIIQLSRMIASGVASTIVYEAEVNRMKAAAQEAAKVQTELFEQLTEHQRLLQLQDRRFRALAEQVGVAIFVANSEGKYTFRNNTWFQLFPAATDDIYFQTTWDKMLDEHSAMIATEAWQHLLAGKEQLRIEMQLKRTFLPIDEPQRDTVQEVQHHVWVLASAFSGLSDDGTVEEITWVFTDISHQKRSEKTQQLLTDNALESRRQLEQFMDTTSHEMRNPLSAITHCADELLSSAQDALGKHTLSSNALFHNKESITSIIESAETIVSCSTHMTRIVDDVLTVSKLNGNLIVITPANVQPVTEMKKIVRMFKAEAKAAEVDLKDLTVSPRYLEYDIDYVNMDPIRVTQIAVNLISNAIKFTRFEAVREVQVILDASLEEPSEEFDAYRFVRTKSLRQDVDLETATSEGEALYVIISVQDTGKGLSSKDADALFTRFSQGSPRTFIKYGGNGLGLFISRKIVELHGGAIGFSSKPDEGSVFSFYVKVHRPRQTLAIPITKHLSFPTNAKLQAKKSSNGDQFLTQFEPKISEQGRLHILVVEDNLVNQTVLMKQLKKLGHSVDAANNGLECLSYIEKTKYWLPAMSNGKELSIILLDWEMPVCDGLTCASMIRNLQKENRITGHIPIIGITANVRSQQVEKALASGMDDVLGKPFRISDLNERMLVLLNKYSLSDQGLCKLTDNKAVVG